jgi:hypothetical protein
MRLPKTLRPNSGLRVLKFSFAQMAGVAQMGIKDCIQTEFRAVLQTRFFC